MPPIQITGRAIREGVRQGFGGLLSPGLGAEIIYSFIIIACSLMIYFATKELYQLSKHKGIRYFRLSFLFFAIAYFFRSFIKIILIYFGRQELRLILPIFGHITLFIFLYFSIMAIFFLIYSALYKKWNKNYLIYLFHIISVFISLILTLTGFPLRLYLFVNLLLFLFILYAVYISYHQSRKKKSLNLYVIYLLLSVFWTFNIIDIIVPSFFQTFQLLIYIFSTGIFLAILYKVLRKTG